MPWIHVAIALASIIVAMWITKDLGEEYAWVNRKIIHFSITPAIIMLYLGFIPKSIFSGFAMAFALGQLLFHAFKKEFKWFQIKGNYGEVYFAISASIISLALPVEKATPILLVMAISDGLTGIVRFYYFKRIGFNVKLKKHWSGSLAFFSSAIIIGGPFFGLKAIPWALLLTLAEYQKFIDDNIMVPLVGAIILLKTPI
ncbi:membrane protein [Pyrococcus sp. ST04]|uniref:membrane protein n=1 Tax=Pyrococcus sp. ST04 TaxID=1183377 RepID=UPI00026059D0|nr:membrane protein [Pyrococcus sp. ST04]AFK21889.1 putative membrance protein [Pyrococcus sp. ST04]